MLFHRNRKRTLGVVTSAVVLLVATMVLPAWAATPAEAEQVRAEARSSGWLGWWEWLTALFDEPTAMTAADSDPREDDPDEDGGDGQNDPSGSGGGLDPAPTLDPGGGRRW